MDSIDYMDMVLQVTQLSARMLCRGYTDILNKYLIYKREPMFYNIKKVISLSSN